MIESDVCRRGGLILGATLVLAGCVVEEPPTPAVSRAAEAPQGAATPVPAVKTSVPKRESVPMPGAITAVDLGHLIELRDAGKAFLVDVRPGLIYRMDHIPDAVSLPRKSFDSLWPERKADLDAAVAAGKVLVLYCANAECPDGYAVAKKLSAMGYAVSVYKAGWEEWKMTGFR